MGFLSGMFGRGSKKQTKGRGPGRSPRERFEKLKLRRLEELKRTNPARYAEIIDAELGIDARKQTLDIETVLAVKEYLNQMGLKIVPLKGGSSLDDDSLTSIIRDFAPLVQAILPQQQQIVQNPATVHPNEYQQPVAEEPRPQLPEPKPEPQHEVPMSALSKIVISNLQNRSPEQAAQWLMEQPIARPVVDAIINSSDEQVPMILDSIVQSQPDLAGAMQWLRRQPDYLMAMVRAVRHFAGGNEGQGDAIGI